MFMEVALVSVLLILNSYFLPEHSLRYNFGNKIYRGCAIAFTFLLCLSVDKYLFTVDNKDSGVVSESLLLT